MKDDDFKLLRGFDYGQTDEQTDICDCRVAFATEKTLVILTFSVSIVTPCQSVCLSVHPSVSQ